MVYCRYEEVKRGLLPLCLFVLFCFVKWKMEKWKMENGKWMEYSSFYLLNVDIHACVGRYDEVLVGGGRVTILYIYLCHCSF